LIEKENNSSSVRDSFDLNDHIAIITGGGGLLGQKHAEAILECGGIPVLLDIDEDKVQEIATSLESKYDRQCLGLCVDITQPNQVETSCQNLLDQFGRIDILINNATNNPRIEDIANKDFLRLEKLPLDVWNDDLTVGLTGAFLCSRAFGAVMSKAGKGVILNVSSDLGLIGPDQRIYTKGGVVDENQPVKPVTYSVVKSGLIGLTRYLATYWADKGVRANAIAPGGVYTDQEDSFVKQLTGLIPMGRMADADEYKAAVAFMVSDASSYMTGSILPIDGGRTCW
jgi:NAD(P)-dependent dehydrogenase (short-subunit alcohol dehydrogenase family)